MRYLHVRTTYMDGCCKFHSCQTLIRFWKYLEVVGQRRHKFTHWACMLMIVKRVKLSLRATHSLLSQFKFSITPAQPIPHCHLSDLKVRYTTYKNLAAARKIVQLFCTRKNRKSAHILWSSWIQTLCRSVEGFTETASNAQQAVGLKGKLVPTLMLL